MVKKFWKNILFFAVLFFLTFFFLLKGTNPKEIVGTLKTISPIFLLIGISLRFIYMLMEALSVKIVLSSFGIKAKLKNTLKYALLGFFYSSITPSATGGQPMQMYYMKKEDIPISHSSLTLLITSSAFYISILILMFGGFIYNYHYLKINMPHFSILIILGLIIISTLLTITLMLIFSPKATEFLKRILLSLVKTFKLKNGETIQKKIDEEIKNYHTCRTFFKKNKKIYALVLGLTLIQELAHYSINYVTMRAFHINNYSLWQMISLQAVLFASISMIPLPGSMGANEMGYRVIYKPIIGTKLMNSAIILTRFMEFYFYVLLGGIVAVVTHLKVVAKDDREEKGVL